jgi:hypothetical protein
VRTRPEARKDQIQWENKKKNEQHAQNAKIDFFIKIKQDPYNYGCHRPLYYLIIGMKI